jgi:hypothetical protein
VKMRLMIEFKRGAGEIVREQADVTNFPADL